MGYISRRRFKAATSGVLAMTLLLSGCAMDDNGDADNTTAESSAAVSNVPGVKGTELPIDTLPENIGQGDAATQCPYLDGDWLQNTNGQRLTAVGLDQRFDPPACVFWSYEDEPQATVMVRKMTSNDDAVKVVDFAAPIDSTQKALKPEGWSGGRRGGDEDSGALYAVWKDEKAVVVFTAQDQSLKAEQIAIETIKNLGL